MRRTLLMATFLALAVTLPALAGDESSQSEVDYLLQHVANSACTFTRNGQEHSAADAADHLRLKYARGQRWVDTAEDFIDRLASESSWSGEAYTVTCDGKSENTGPWLHRALDAYRRENRDEPET